VILLLSSTDGRSQPAKGTATVREFDAVCARCHAEIFQRYTKTSMANASGPATEGIELGTFTHRASGVQYRVFVENGSAWLGYSRECDPSIHGRKRLEYFLGSGNHGRTYLYSTDRYWFETPIAWYARKHGYDMRPAYSDDKEMPLNLPMTSGCLRCHATEVQTEEPGTRNRFASIPFLHGGVACENCHGAASAHAASSGKAAVINPAKLDPERRDSICIICHLEGETSVPRLGHSLLDFRPGGRAGDYASWFILAGAGTAKRAVSQVEAFQLSRCKRASGERMSCITCHDPHGSPAGQNRVAFYRSKCLTCHTESRFAVSHYPSQPDCTQCHMPKRLPEDIPHEQWTDHRIVRESSDLALQPAISGDTSLIAVPGIVQHPSSRDVAMAYSDVAAHGDVALLKRARSLLEAAIQPDAADSDLLTAAGVVAQMENDRAAAADEYRRALGRNPDDYKAAMNLGVLLARSGQAGKASDLWSQLFSRNEDMTDLGMNLEAARCMTGDRAGAIDALRTVLSYNPDHQRGRKELQTLESDPRLCLPK
jgi:predicted CXXCH cytochrome family protein